MTKAIDVQSTTTSQQTTPLTQEMILNLIMGKVNPFANVDVSVKKEGIKLILPEKMTYEQGIDILKRKIQEEQQEVDINEVVDCYPLDGAFAMMQVLKERYGWAQATTELRQTMFGIKKIPPQMMTLEVGHEKFDQVIWGQFIVPGVEGALKTGVAMKGGMMVFAINGQVKQRYREEIKELADAIRAYVKIHSVYRGKAIRLKTDEEGNLQTNNPPGFLDLTKVDENELTFSEEVMDQVQTNLFTPIEKTAECRRYGIPLKRGVLLEGKYGTGKTLTAYVTAKKAEANGWTFVYLDRVSALKSAMLFAKTYGNCVIFAEDIDRVTEGGRSVKIDDILNQIDGVESKGQELIVILTSNHVENINKAMLRPGRLDAIIGVTAPDAVAAAKLVRLYARGLIDPKADLKEAGEELNGQIPAVIREVVERSKLAGITRLKPGQTLELIAKDLVIAAKGMASHLELMKPTVKEMNDEEQLGHVLKKVLVGEKDRLIKKHGKDIEAIAESLGVELQA